MWLIALTAFYFIPCESETFCPQGRLESVPAAIEDYKANSALLFQSLAIIIIIPCSSISGVTTTKRGSASQRITVLLARNLVVWVFFIFVPVGTGADGNPLYSEYFSFLQLGGFLIMSLGILLFNEIIVLPCF